MRPHLLVIVIMNFLWIVPAYGQSERIDFIYELVWKEDSLNLDKTKKEEMILQLGGAESCFQSMVNYNFERNVADFEKTARAGGVVSGSAVKKIKPVFTYRIYKTPASLHVEEKIMRRWYTYKMDFDTDDWEIHSEQDSIAGYWSQKATIDYNGRSYVAWFTNAIPISDGPYIFHGLPGLIVRLYDSQNHYTFTLKEARKGESAWPETVKNIIPSTFKNVSELKRSLRRDPLVDPLVSGFFSDPQAIENLRKKAKMNNNPLEKNQ